MSLLSTSSPAKERCRSRPIILFRNYLMSYEPLYDAQGEVKEDICAEYLFQFLSMIIEYCIRHIKEM